MLAEPWGFRAVNRSAGLAGALAVVLATTSVVGVVRTTSYALHHDPHGGGPVGLWALVFMPVSCGMAVVLLAATGRPRVLLRQSAFFFLAAAAGVVLAMITYSVTMHHVGCYSTNGSDDCGFSLGVGMSIGSVLLFGATVVIFSSPVQRW